MGEINTQVLLTHVCPRLVKTEGTMEGEGVHDSETRNQGEQTTSNSGSTSYWRAKALISGYFSATDIIN